MLCVCGQRRRGLKDVCVQVAETAERLVNMLRRDEASAIDQDADGWSHGTDGIEATVNDSHLIPPSNVQEDEEDEDSVIQEI